MTAFGEDFAGARVEIVRSCGTAISLWRNVRVVGLLGIIGGENQFDRATVLSLKRTSAEVKGEFLSEKRLF